MAKHFHQLGTAFARGVRTSLRNNSAAFGYSILVTSDFALLAHFGKQPGPLEIFSFIAGAVVAFAVLEAGSTRWFHITKRGEPADVVALGTTFSIASISAGAATSAGVGYWVSGWVAWPLSAFISTIVYLLMVSLEMMLADYAERQK